MARETILKSFTSMFRPQVVEKLNPGQRYIAHHEGPVLDPAPHNHWSYYEQLGVVNRAVNMVVDAASQIDIIVGDDKLDQDMPPRGGTKKARVEKLLNTEPNPFQDISTFRRLLFTDLVVDGNAFIYYDGVHIYHLPAYLVSIVTDTKFYVKGFTMTGANGDIKYGPDEVIHIKDNSIRGVYRGISRLGSAKTAMVLLWRMIKYQDKFFENGAIPGLVLKSPNSLSEKLKDKMIESWLKQYSPNAGGRRPLILDGGMELDRLSNTNFKELDFEVSIVKQEHAVLKTLGIPPVLLDGGNNANIRPNQRLFYIETVIPLVDKVMKGYERFFGWELIPDNDIPGLQPELQEQATYAVSLVNGGIITPNEARKTLAFEESEDPEMDEIRIPVNVAGSAADPSQGGRPPKKATE
jgi:HK97 family phage portal protein